MAPDDRAQYLLYVDEKATESGFKRWMRTAMLGRWNRTSRSRISALSRTIETDRLRAAIEELPAEFREVVVLKDLQGLSYREIAEIVAVPIGTVMSRLSRGRQRLTERLSVQKGAR